MATKLDKQMTPEVWAETLIQQLSDWPHVVRHTAAEQAKRASCPKIIYTHRLLVESTGPIGALGCCCKHCCEAENSAPQCRSINFTNELCSKMFASCAEICDRGLFLTSWASNIRGIFSHLTFWPLWPLTFSLWHTPVSIWIKESINGSQLFNHHQAVCVIPSSLL